MIGIDDAIAAGATLVDMVVKRIWPDATELEKDKLAQLTLQLQAEWANQLGQLEVNKIEAASSSLLVAGWRPMVGWICATGLAYAAILEPIARFIATVGFAYLGVFPAIDTGITLQILLALLGLGGMRTFEKFKGVHAK